MLQAIAAGWHHKSPEQVASIAASVGARRILVVHGTVDRMITFRHGEALLEALGGEKAGVTKQFVEGQGHVVPIEMRQDFNSWIAELADRTRSLKD
jgi:predicted esterase